MNNQSKEKKIASFGRAFDELEVALTTIPQESWKYKPSDKEWSIHEIIIHLADIEANITVRLLKALAEPNGTIMPLDQDLWANNLFYLQQDATIAIQVYKWLRLKNYHMLLLLPDDKWNCHMHHPEMGMVSLDSWLNNYEQHGRIHIEQIKRVYQQWMKDNLQSK